MPVLCPISIYIIYLCARALSVQHSDPCALSALEPFFCEFSAARPRFVARLAPSDSPQSRGPCPRAGPPLQRPSRSASEVARSRLCGLPHAPQSQPCSFTTTSLLGFSYSPAVTLSFLLFSFWFSTVMVWFLLLLLPAAAAHNIVLKRREMLGTSIAAVVLGCFYFCPLDCDASVMVVDGAAVETGCMLERK